MDIISPGLSFRSSRSRKLINEINNNNRISSLIQNQFKNLNNYTELFLSQELIKFDSIEDEKFNTLQSIFQDLIYHLNLQDFSLESILHLNLQKLQQSYNKLNLSGNTGDADDADDIGRNDVSGGSVVDIESLRRFDSLTGKSEIAALNSTTNNLINHYILLSTNLTYSNSLIYNTLILKNQLVYWENLNLSTRSKLIFFIQILPRKCWEFISSVYNHILQTSPEDPVVLKTNGVEEDNLLYHTYDKLWRNCNLVSKSLRKVIKKSFVELNPTFSIFKSKTPWYKILNFYLKTPVNIATKEINIKINLINQHITQNTAQIDALVKLNYDEKDQMLTTMESFFKKTPSKSFNHRVYNVLLETIKYQTSVDYSSTDMPSFITRYWPILILLINYGPSKSIDIYNNRQEILDWIQFNLVDTTVGFFKNWLVKPINDMLNILRHDDTITITSKESLQSDLDSLERMVVDFVADEHVSGLSREQIHESIVNGDLTLLMSKYESQIRTPYKSLLQGGLIRSLLIQIQKTKVDGALALTGIDKLLKSQQLLFGLVSVSPSLFIVWKITQYLTTAKPLIINGNQVNMLCLKGLNNIENLLVLLNQTSDSSENYEGRLLIEIVNLVITSKYIIPKQLQNDWIDDLNELNNSDFDFDTKLDLVRKIWNMYGHYFR